MRGSALWFRWPSLTPRLDSYKCERPGVGGRAFRLTHTHACWRTVDRRNVDEHEVSRIELGVQVVQHIEYNFRYRFQVIRGCPTAVIDTQEKDYRPKL